MLKEIPVSSITCLPNYRTIDNVNDQDFKDLVTSIKKDGVMQAGLVRPHPTKKEQYQLVFGNRRFAAAVAAGLLSFPATVKEVADDDILELQVMENLQRKDVHPMDEAAAYKAYQAKKNVDIKELAAVFAKTERYITHRLQLTTLIEPLQKDFLKGMMTVAQAEVFARVDDKQQKELKDYAYRSWEKKYTSTPEQLKKKIEEDFLLKLDAAPWKRDDATLYPDAGACNSCPKRTSCKGLLFADLVKDDRCTDKACYKKKKDLWFITEVEKVATTKPDIKFARGYDEPPKELKKIAEKFSITVINSRDAGVGSWKETGSTPVKVFWISGHDAGKYGTLYIENKSKAAGKAAKGDNSAAGIKMQQQAIQQRLDRAKELDYEKEQETIIKAIEAISPDDKLATEAFTENKRYEFLLMLAYDGLNWGDDELLEALGLGDDAMEHLEKTPDLLYNKICSLNDVAITSILRNVLLNKFRSEKRFGLKTYIVRQLAKCLGVDVVAIVAAQNEIAAKREANAAKRIEGLKAAVAPKAKKVAASAKKVAPATKKKTKKAA